MKKNKNLINKIMGASLGLSILVIIFGALFITVGPSDFLKDFFGSNQLEEIDFETFTRAKLEDQYLVCPEDFCLEATPNLIAPLFKQSTSQLRTVLLEYVDNTPFITTNSMNIGSQQFTFLVSNFSKPFPDVVTVRFIDLQGRYSSVAIYARTEIGKANIGANKELVSRWLALLSKNE